MFENRTALAATPEEELVLDCLAAGIRAAHPRSVVERTVSVTGTDLRIDGAVYDIGAYDRVLVLGGGNAAGHVAAALETRLGDHIDDGVVVTDDPAKLSRITCIEGEHPIPNEAAANGTREILELASGVTDDDLVLTVVTGGGSALLPAPAGDIELPELRETTEALLRAGATITEINTIRKHLSDIKGGRLAAAANPAKTVGIVFSDVVGNELGSIASGPISPDETTYADARDIVDRYDLDVPQGVHTHLQRGNRGTHRETPSEESSVFDDVSVHILADNGTALEAARDVALERDYRPLILSARVRGEAREVAKVHVGVAEETLASGNPVQPPAVLISGGETTVTITGDGRGGPNQEFAVSAALELDSADIFVGAVDSDGIDGSTDAAGALVGQETFDDLGVAQTALSRNDVYPLLDAAGGLLRTGATGTNVNDLRVIVVSA